MPHRNRKEITVSLKETPSRAEIEKSLDSQLKSTEPKTALLKFETFKFNGHRVTRGGAVVTRIGALPDGTEVIEGYLDSIRLERGDWLSLRIEKDVPKFFRFEIGKDNELPVVTLSHTDWRS